MFIGLKFIIVKVCFGKVGDEMVFRVNIRMVKVNKIMLKNAVNIIWDNL